MSFKNDLEIVFIDLIEAGNYMMSDKIAASAMHIGSCGARLRIIIDSLDDNDEEDEEDEEDEKDPMNEFFSMLQKNYNESKGKNGQKD